MAVESFVRLEEIENGLFRLELDAADAKVNILSKAAIAELETCIQQLPVDRIKGLMITSAKPSFVVGADIGEFCENFSYSGSEIAQYSKRVYTLFNTIEDLPFPTLSVICGEALGGGFELALSTDFRVLADNAKVGLPEVNLGILPGWGGTVRLPRVIGLDNALAWMTSGRPKKALEALKVGVAHAVVAGDQLEQAALSMLQSAVDGSLGYQKQRQKKLNALAMSPVEVTMACNTAAGMATHINTEHYPATQAIIDTVKVSVSMGREQAQQCESEAFITLAKTPTVTNLVTLFLNDKALKKRNSRSGKQAEKVTQSAVLGAGVMGGGVAYQSASTGTDVVMKDIQSIALDAGMAEANRLLLGQVKRGRLSPEKMLKTAQKITPTLDYKALEESQFVVEAVVENLKIKRQVLAEVEQHVSEGCVLATNTSTLTIQQLQDNVQHPERLCGMHFFNPVHRMPLVEIIRGPLTSDTAVQQAVAYALSMKKVPVVVQDCPGFLVNRILLPYIHAFTRLVLDGIDFERIDRVMEAFGWPMGPATLMDIVGMDTGCHAATIMGEAYPDRLSDDTRNATHALFEAGRLGQKTSAGYYRYEQDKRGRVRKKSDPEAHAIVESIVRNSVELSDEQIIQRMMIPLCIEAVRCLEEGVAHSAGDIDVAMINGVGFPRYLGGVFGYIDRLGCHNFVAQCERYLELGKAYQPTEGLTEMANNQQSYFSTFAHTSSDSNAGQQA